MKKIMLTLAIVILLVSTVSAFEFDNVKSYDSLTKTATIENAFGLGDTIAEVTLKTPQINYVIAGKDRLVAEFEINNYDVYTNVFNNMEFYDLKRDSEKFDREFTYKYKVITGTEEVPIYEKVCNEVVLKNSSIREECNLVIKDYSTREIKGWRVLDTKTELPKGIIRIGIFTDVERGEHVEWIPTLFGVEIVEWAEWTEGLNIGLTHYYNMNNVTDTQTNVVENVFGINNGTAQQGATWGAGILDGAAKCDGVNDYINLTGWTDTQGVNYTFNWWWKTTDAGTNNQVLDFETGRLALELWSGNINYYDSDGGDVTLKTGGTQTDGNWHMITFLFNDTDATLYYDGSFTNTGQFSSTNLGGAISLCSKFDGTANFYEGLIDELGGWNRTLSSSEITQLYNGGVGITYIPPIKVSTTTLLTPVNDTNSSVQVDDFTFNITLDGGDWTNYTFTVWDDGDNVIKNRVVINGTPDADCSETYQVNNIYVECIGQAISADGNYHWNAEGCLDSGLCDSADSNFTFTIDSTAPTIEISYPENISYTELITRINVTYTEANPAYCWYSNDSGVTNSSGIDCDLNFTSLTYGQGSYTITTYINDTFGNNGASTPITFFVDSIAPSLTITSPSNYTNSTDNTLDVDYTYVETNPDSCWWTEDGGVTNTTITCGTNITTETWSDGSHNVQLYMNDTLNNVGSTGVYFSIDTSLPSISVDDLGLIDYHYSGNQLTINWTVTDSNGLDTCILEYAGVNNTVTCSNNGTYINVTNYNYDEVILFANDTFGNSNSDSMNWSYKIFENSRSFTASDYEMSSQDFELNITVGTGVTINSVALIYDSESQSSTIDTYGDNRIISNTYTVPSITAPENKEFNWSITYTYSAVVDTLSTYSSEQSLKTVYLGICDADYTTVAANFTTLDEDDGSLLNNTIDFSIQYYPSNGDGTITKTFAYSNTTEDTPYRAICINASDINLKVSGLVSYESTGYDTRSYIFDADDMNNVTQYIDLYLALIDDSDIVTFTVVDDFESAVEGAQIVIEKWYLGNDSYSPVNTLTTNSEGIAASNLILYSTYYRFKVYYGGTLYLTEGPYLLSSTTKNFKIYFTEQSDYSLFQYVDHSLTHDSDTNNTAFVWTSSTSLVNTTQGCLVITNVTDSNVVYDNCFDISSGTVSVIVNSPGTYSAHGVVTISDDGVLLSKLFDELVFTVGKPTNYIIMSTYGQAASFLLIGTAAVIGVAAGSIILGFGLMTLTMIFINWIGFLDLRAFIWSVISLIIIITVVSVRKKR